MRRSKLLFEIVSQLVLIGVLLVGASVAPGHDEPPGKQARSISDGAPVYKDPSTTKDGYPAKDTLNQGKGGGQAEQASLDTDLEKGSQSEAQLLSQLSRIGNQDDEHGDEMMLRMMTEHAELVISTHPSFDSTDIEKILSGSMESIHPSTLLNSSFNADLFASGGVLPVVSDTNKDGKISVDEILSAFFHADRTEMLFKDIEVQDNVKLKKSDKKQVIKQEAPQLHHTIKKVASNRGWGIQDERFTLPEEQLKEDSAFKDYTTFVKTLRDALMTDDSD